MSKNAHNDDMVKEDPYLFDKYKKVLAEFEINSPEELQEQLFRLDRLEEAVAIVRDKAPLLAAVSDIFGRIG